MNHCIMTDEALLSFLPVILGFPSLEESTIVAVEVNQLGWPLAISTEVHP